MPAGGLQSRVTSGIAKQPEQQRCVPAGGLQSVTFKELRRISPNMLALSVGRFRKVAEGSDPSARPTAVWALPSAQPSDAEVPGQILTASIPAWEAFTGAELQELGKLDMLIWNGMFPWSTSQFGLLRMDPFRPLWNKDVRCGARSHLAPHCGTRTSGAAP